ncbi:MAG: DUF6430 domain-containing protein [Candidatus Sumerlaeota bacterium]|nr:DUF6430 domain-containing protein [Candidatus Sumerlaeota bacterium]
MIDILRGYFSISYWRHTVWSSETAKILLATTGPLWLLFNLPGYFGVLASWKPFFQDHLSIYVGLCALTTIIIRHPVTSVSSCLSSRDVAIEVRVGNLFCLRNASLVVSTNTTFETDTNNGLVAKDSIQGQFTEQYFDSVSHLDKDIDEALKGIHVEEHLQDGRPGKTNRYRIGTVAQVRPMGRTCYLLAVGNITATGNCESSFEMVKQALAALWNHVQMKGGIEPIAIGVLGTGRGRLVEKREIVIREIIESFVAACASRRFTEKLIVVISPDDYRKHAIDLKDIGMFVRYVCKYTELKKPQDKGSGVAVL